MTALERPDHAATLRRELADPRAVCQALGLLGGRRGVDFILQATGVTVTCPIHGGCSLSVTRGKAGDLRIKCFGPCELAGDVLSLVAAVRGLDVRRDFRAVLREAAELAGDWGLVAELDGATTTSTRPARVLRIVPRVADELSSLDAVTFDRLGVAICERSPLTSDAEACRYLDGRRMLDLALDAGWCSLPSTVAGRAELVAELVAIFGDDALRRSGLFRRDGALRLVWDEHRLCIPWRSSAGLVQTVQRRLVRPPRDDERSRRYVFPSGRGPASPYTVRGDVEGMSTGAAVAYVEGSVDALALRSIARSKGVDVLVLGLPGVSAWRAEWASVAIGRPAIIALDADAAGEAHVVTMTRDLSASTSIARWMPRNAKDWADVLARVRT